MTFSYKGSLSYDSPQIFRARVSGLLFVRPAWPFGVGTYGSGASQSEERSYEYDSLDRLTKITFEDGKTMEYEYDEEGNVTKITEFRYYGDNRLHEITYVRGEEGADSQTFTYFYDPGGRPLRLEYPEDTGINGATPTPAPGWDGNGQLRHLREGDDRPDGSASNSMKDQCTDNVHELGGA